MPSNKTNTNANQNQTSQSSNAGQNTNQANTNQGNFNQANNGFNFNQNQQQNIDEQAILDRLFSTVAANGVSEQASDLHSRINELLDKRVATQSSKSFAILAPSQSINHLYDGIAVVTETAVNGKPTWTHHLLIVESEIEMQPRNVQVSQDGTQAQFIETAATTVTPGVLKATSELVANWLAANTKHQTPTVLPSGFTVVHRDLTYSASELLDTALKLAAEATMLATPASVTADATNLYMAARLKNYTLSANVDEHPQQIKAANGQPIRADFVVKAAITPNTNNNYNPNYGSRNNARPLGSVAIYNTPIYAPVSPQMQSQQFGQPVQNNVPAYINRVVISGLFAHGKERLSLPNALLLLASTARFTQNAAWMAAYQPNHHIKTGSLDLHDVGALALRDPSLNPENYNEHGQYLANNLKYNPVDLKNANIKPDNVFQYLRRAFRPSETIYTLEVSEGHHLMELFRGAATKDPVSCRIITTALDGLTNNAFSKKYPTTQPMFVWLNERRPRGTFVGHGVRGLDAIKRPLADVDYLALLNMGTNAVEAVTKWEAIEFNNQYGGEAKVALTTTLLANLAPSMIVHGYNQWIDIHPAFFDAMVSSLLEAGVFPAMHYRDQYTNSDYSQNYAAYESRVINSNMFANANMSGGNTQFGGMNGAAFNQGFGGNAPWTNFGA